jgi:hypothetical protein
LYSGVNFRLVFMLEHSLTAQFLRKRRVQFIGVRTLPPLFDGACSIW